MSSEMPTLEEELRGIMNQIAELDRQRETLSELIALEEDRRILAKQEDYLRSLGLFRRADKKRMEEQIREKKQQITELEIRLENRQHSIEDQIADLNLAKAAIETEMSRRASENE